MIRNNTLESKRSPPNDDDESGSLLALPAEKLPDNATTLAGVGNQELVDTYRQLSLDLQEARDNQTINHMVAVEEALRKRDIDPDAIIRDLWD